MSSVTYMVTTEYTENKVVIDATIADLTKFGKVSVVVNAPALVHTACAYDEDVFSGEVLRTKFFVGRHNSYFNGHGLVYDNLASAEQQHDVLCRRPLYMYAHSGIALSHAPFSCPWDSGQVGVHVVLKSDLLAAGFSEGEITFDLGEDMLDSELQFVNAYVHGYLYDIIVDDEEGDTVDMFTVDCTRIPESLYGKGHATLTDEQRQKVSEIEKSIENAVRS